MQREKSVKRNLLATKVKSTRSVKKMDQEKNVPRKHSDIQSKII